MASSAAKAGTGTVKPVAVPASSHPSSKRARKGADAVHGIGPSLVRRIAGRLNRRRKLKLKYEKANRTGRIGKTPHDRKLFELSRGLWGKGGGGVATSPKEGRHAAAPSKLPEEESEEKDWAGVFWLLQLKGMGVKELNGMGLDEQILRVGMRMVDCSKVEEIKERLLELRMAEMQIAVDGTVVLNDLAKLILDGYRAAKK